MKIVLHHPVLLPAKHYGGVERVVIWLARGLRDLGHTVSVVAREGSQLPSGVELIAVTSDQTGLEGNWRKRLPTSVDCVHFMAPVAQANAMENLKFPYLLTIHGNGKPGEVFPINTCFLSRDHAVRHHRDWFVYNGLDPEEYQSTLWERRENFLFLSKTSWPVKNLSGAMRLCSQADVGLDIAGGSGPWGLRLRALFDSQKRWIGPVNDRQKRDVLSRSRGLVFPILWDEPFGLVMVEALLSGAPVYGSPRGSVPEIIDRPEFGRVIGSSEEWISALQTKALFDPEACRRMAIERFHFHRMTESYLELYRKVQSL
jgi:glycosyltransferase involved in cell wall biosynthesis